MNKKEVQKRVLKDGEPLSIDLFNWCEKTKTFSSDQYYLVIDFSGVDYCTIKAHWDCTIKAGSCCTIVAGWYCTIKSDSDCTIKAGSGCTIKAGQKCVVVRRDVFEVIKPEENKLIKLNSHGVHGFVYLNENKVTIELTQEQLDKIKQQGII